MTLVEESREEVIEKALAWKKRIRQDFASIEFRFREEDELYAAVTLLESREAMKATEHLDSETKGRQ